MKSKFKRKKGWCECCDKAVVEFGTKCDVCGARNYGVKEKSSNCKLMADYRKGLFDQ